MYFGVQRRSSGALGGHGRSWYRVGGGCCPSPNPMAPPWGGHPVGPKVGPSLELIMPMTVSFGGGCLGELGGPW